MIPQPPPGQGPIDPQGAFVPPPTPGGAPAGPPPPSFHGRPPAGPPLWSPAGYTPPPARGGGGVWTFFNRFFLVLFFGGSLILNLILIVALGVSAGTGQDNFPVIHTTLKTGDEKQKIAVVTLSGAIDGNTAQRFDRLLDTVEKDADVKTLVLEIDSPGGTVTGSDEIYARVLRYKADRKAANKNANVVVTMRSLAASGGYYVACAGDHVFAEQTTLTGNIGVLMSGFNVSGLMEKYGVSETTIVSSGADFKNAGSPFSPESPEGRKYLQAICDQAFVQFQNVVKAGRGSKIAGKDVFNGKVFSGPDALQLGLVDQLGYADDAYAHAAKLAGLTNPTVVRYREPIPSMLSMVLGAASSQAEPKADATAAAPTLRDLAKPETLDQWRTTRLLYR